MPTRAPRRCPRCLSTFTGRRCEVCSKRREVRQDKTRAGLDHHNSARWRRESQAFLREHPLCECEECIELPAFARQMATDVDHRDGLGLRGPRAWDWSNWQALSHPHHSRKTVMFDGGFGTKRKRESNG